ncbi:DUF6702 family protein [Niabella soli]|uniref:Uncharacterized protein n=1 Tax=Niabella soli DSM 19437 TaxID=929713 RepID=W0F5Q9_9BACT|nr:DUF6702 family protein [Niabella soli]AHF16804.1 hypothetical protein NIASO_19725 [Niabella soli DSM 19437]
MAKWINKWRFFLLVLSLLVTGGSFSSTALHPFHVSASEIEYNAKENRLEISSKIFTDDFEKVLERLYKTKADFNNKTLKPQMNGLVTQYITTHLSVRTNGRLLPLKFFGWEVDHEAVYIYTTAAAPNFDAKNITVENTILYDLFEDQLNIVHFIVNGNRKSSKLNYPERKVGFSF